MSTVSFQKSLRTTKVTGDSGAFAQHYRVFDPEYQIAPSRYLVDQYNRPAPISSLQTLSTDTSAFSPLYMIETQNFLNPQYSAYLNVPQGLNALQSNYQSNQTWDTLSGSAVGGRGRAFGYEGTYQMAAPPPPGPNSGVAIDQYMAAVSQKSNDNRFWTDATGY